MQIISEYGHNYGTVGKYTGLSDVTGMPLRVGDLVKVETGPNNIWENIIVEGEPGEFFVMGARQVDLSTKPLRFVQSKIEQTPCFVEDYFRLEPDDWNKPKLVHSIEVVNQVKLDLIKALTQAESIEDIQRVIVQAKGDHSCLR